DHVARVQPGDAHRAADPEALRVAEDDLDDPLRRQEARAVAGQPDQADQAGDGDDHDQADPDLAGREAGAHLSLLWSSSPWSLSPSRRAIASPDGPAPWTILRARWQEDEGLRDHGDGGFSNVGP